MDTLEKKQPYISVQFGHKPHLLILPLIFIEWGNKDYGITFDLGSYSTNFKKIDSISFVIFNEKDSILGSDIIKANTKTGVFNCSSFDYINPKDTICFSGLKTEYKYKLPIKNKLKFKLDIIVYGRKKSNQNFKYYYPSCEVSKREKRFGSFF